MISRDLNRIAPSDDDDSFNSEALKAEFRAKIGGDLRGLFGDMSTATLPDHLVELAGRIDAKRGFGATEA